MAKSPGKDKRKKKQRARQRYSKAREDLQLAGEIATTPEGAVKRLSNPHVDGEVVDPAAQGEQLIVDIPLAAARRGWATPEHKKAKVVDELVRLVESEEVKPFDKVLASNALSKLDQAQWERDNPEAAGKAKGGGTTVPIQINTGAVIQEVLAGVERQKQVGRELEHVEVNQEQAEGDAGDGPQEGRREGAGCLPSGGQEGRRDC